MPVSGNIQEDLLRWGEGLKTEKKGVYIDKQRDLLIIL